MIKISFDGKIKISFDGKINILHEKIILFIEFRHRIIKIYIE